jgi:hypothetical protein
LPVISASNRTVPTKFVGTTVGVNQERKRSGVAPDTVLVPRQKAAINRAANRGRAMGENLAERAVKEKQKRRASVGALNR